MRLVDVVRRECIVAGKEFGGKAEALAELARVAKRSPILRNVGEGAILAALEAREALGSTGFGGGIAIPHCRLDSVPEFVVGLMTIRGGVEFDALDDKPVSLMVFIVAPSVASDQHIRILSAISQILMMRGVMQEILSQETPEGLYESFLRHSVVGIGSQEDAGRSLIHVFVQEESKLKDILQVLTSVQSSSLVVVNVENTRAYLGKIPLFADFWGDEASKFSNLIIAVVERGLANETVRRIESVTGELHKQEGILVTVQEIAYAAGSLRS